MKTPMRRKILRNSLLLTIALTALACASARRTNSSGVEATLSRSGGLSGSVESIRLWSLNGETHGRFSRSNENGSRDIRMPKNTLDSAIVLLDSLAGAAPASPPDTGAMRVVCGDAILTHLEVRRGTKNQSAQETCPLRTAESRAYWDRVNGLFRSLAAAVSSGNQQVLSSPAPAMPAGIRFVSRAEWGAHAPVLPMTARMPDRITIHHTGEPQNFRLTIEQKMRGLQAFSQRADSLESGKKKPAWADVPYHYYVAVDGSVAEGREWEYVGDTNTEYDPAGHLLVVVEGRFDADTLTTAQLRALDAIIPSLAHHFHINGSRLAGHRDFAKTDCPGRNLYAELPRLRALIDQTNPER